MSNSKTKAFYILVLTLSLAGCEFMGPTLHEKMPLEVVDITEEQEQPGVIYQELSNEASDAAVDEGVKIELYPGTGEFISQKIEHSPDKVSAKGAYSLNFDAADLGEVTKVVLSDILGENYVLSPKVTGTVTLQTTQPLSKSELLPTLEMLLEINNAVLIHQDGIFQIKPKSEAVVGSAFGAYNKYKQQITPGHQIRVVPVRNVAATELAEIIKPLLQEKTILHVDEYRNMMLIAGSGAELTRAMEMVDTFDVDVLKGRSFGLFPLQQVAAGTIIEELEQVFNQDRGGTGAGFFQFMEIERLNAILAITHQSRYLNDIERWVMRLDKANTATGGGVNVYRAQHVDAIVMAETLNEIFSQGGQSRRSPSVAAGRKTVEVTNKDKTVSKTAKVFKKSAATSIADIGEVNIIADEPNNALIIVATAQDYAVIHKVIRQLDVMPLQVLIDATIVDVQLTDDLQYGIKWFLQSGKHNVASGEGFDLLGTAAEAATAVSTGGLSYAFISSDVKALLTAEAAKGKVNIVSSPSLMVLNNQEGSIEVAEEKSLLASETTNLSGGDNVTSTVQQRKAGVNVTVKPRVNANGLVIMEITQLVENFIPNSDTNGNPDILTRAVTSSIAVQSGETIVLGGLINEFSTQKKSGIPLLYDLPFIGPLFGETVINKSKTELVLLITPRVVKSRRDARLVTNEFQRKLTGIYEEHVEIIQEE